MHSQGSFRPGAQGHGLCGGRRWRRPALAVLAVALVVTLALPACTAQEAPGLGPGKPAPDFAITDVDGNQLNLNSLRGKVVMLNFWSITCPPCRAEMPEIEAAYQLVKDDAVFVGVAPQDRASDVRDYVKANGFSWNFAVDPSGKVAIPYEVYVFPTTYFIDRQGFIASVHIGGPMSRRLIGDAVQDAMRRAGR